MESGKLRHVVAIQASTPSRDAAGKTSQSWSTAASVRAAFISHTGREFVQAQQIQAEMTHMVRIRHYSGLTTKHRLLFGSRVLGILSIDHRFERGREMIIQCKEAV